MNESITKNGGMSSNGTVEMSNMMLQMAKDNRVKGFLINADSGGGSSAAVKVMVDAINQVKATKPVFALIDKGEWQVQQHTESFRLVLQYILRMV